MALKGFTAVPSPPTRRRRGGRELYEWLCLSMWFVLLLGLLAALLFDFSQRTEVNTKYETEVIKLIGGLLILDTIALMRFDFLAKGREEDSFEFAMTEYRKLRDLYIENQQEIMKIEQEQYRTIYGSQGQLMEPVSTTVVIDDTVPVIEAPDVESE